MLFRSNLGDDVLSDMYEEVSSNIEMLRKKDIADTECYLEELLMMYKEEINEDNGDETFDDEDLFDLEGADEFLDEDF